MVKALKHLNVVVTTTGIPQWNVQRVTLPIHIDRNVCYFIHLRKTHCQTSDTYVFNSDPQTLIIE